jgi:6,7-dimethyl-8-ribityllumazine synthase
MNALSKPIVIIAAEFNKELMEEMIIAAKQEAQDVGATVTRIIRVPGCYEVPLIASLQVSLDEIDAIVVLGYIERGETLHGEVMGHVVHAALINLQLKYKKPIGIGIIGPGATKDQAEIRKMDYARAAVRAALRNSELVNPK